MKYYVDSAGTFIGGWAANPPEGLIEAPSAPDDARQKLLNGVWVWPPSSYSDDLSELNRVYQADIDTLNRAHSVAAMAGGSTQAAKQAAITVQFNARKAKYVADLNALRAQHGA